MQFDACRFRGAKKEFSIRSFFPFLGLLFASKAAPEGEFRPVGISP
jgi:hypothetical protein